MKYNGTSVHWHVSTCLTNLCLGFIESLTKFRGIRQNQTMHMDGVNGITQCPIASGDYFVYNFTAGQYGSSWYHSHYSVQYADGAAGPITLHGPTSDNFDEAISPPLIMTDWGHNSAFNAITSTSGLSDPDILLNGRGDIRKYNNKIQNTTEVLPPYSITFQGPQVGVPNNKYLIRIINTSFQSTFVFSIDNHLLNIVEADFVPISPYTNTSILVGIGQRYNVIVEAKPIQDPENPIPLPADGNYWIRTFVIPCFGDMQPGSPGYMETGILRYNSSSTASPSTSQWTDISLDAQTKLTTVCTPSFRGLLATQPTIPLVEKASISASSVEVTHWRFGKDSVSALGFGLTHSRNLGSNDSPAIRVDYSNITFFNLDNKGSWNSEWRIQSEDYNATSWVSP
jgi:Multicopper oxidase